MRPDVVHARTFTRTCVWLKISECTSKVISSIVVKSLIGIPDFDFSFLLLISTDLVSDPNDHADRNPNKITAAPLRGEYGQVADGTSNTVSGASSQHHSGELTSCVLQMIVFHFI